MGKGDQKTRRGKIQVGSFGNVRPRKTAKVNAPKDKTEVVAKKAAPKKAAAKKEAK